MLDPKELAYFEQMITERREKILATVRPEEARFREGTTKDSAGDLSAYSVHMPDQGTDAMEREMGFILATREDKYIKHLDEALERIHNGTFGICRTCSRPIGRARLEAVPNATECIDCKSGRPVPRQ